MAKRKPSDGDGEGFDVGSEADYAQPSTPQAAPEETLTSGAVVETKFDPGATPHVPKMNQESMKSIDEAHRNKSREVRLHALAITHPEVRELIAENEELKDQISRKR